jgi:hypothetical protein
MPHPLNGANAKIQRAEAYVDDLEDKVNAYLGSQPIAIENLDDPIGKSDVFAGSPERKPSLPPNSA